MGIQTQELDNYLIFPESISISVSALAIAVIKSKTKDLDLMSITGLGTVMPITCVAVAAANLSVAGMPLFAMFSGIPSTLEQPGNNIDWIRWSAFAGNVGLMLGVLAFEAIIQ